MSGRPKVHGHCAKTGKTPTYISWVAMIARCHNKNDPFYHRYGGRGIKVCDRWRGSFANFLEDMGERTRSQSIERIDNEKGYEPGNCKWIEKKKQARNRSSNLLVEFRGETKPLIVFAEESGLKYQTVFARIRVRGWDIDKALTTKIGK